MLFFRKSVTFIKSLTCLMKKNSKNNSNNFLSSKWITLKSFIQQSSLITEAAVRGCFAKFTRKFLQNSQENARLSFLIKLQVSLSACNFIIKWLYHSCFPGDFAKFLRASIFIEHLEWLLLLLKTKTLYSDITYFFLTQQLRHNPYIIELFRLEFLV